MSWLIYAGVGYLVYKLAQTGQLTLNKPTKPKKKKKKRNRKPRSEQLAHEVLGVSADATEEEVRHAYQELMRQYHPDKVANAAEELRDLANRRSKEINAAYEQMKSRAAAT